MADVSETLPILSTIAANPQGQQGQQRKREGDKDGEDEDKKPLSVDDITSIMGIPNEDMTPQIREALLSVINDQARLRRDLDTAEERLEYLDDQADRHAFLPVITRHGLMRALSRVLQRSVQVPESSCFLCLSIRNLDDVRRRLGRIASEGILTQVAGAIAEQTGDRGIVGSLDGYDFGIILPLTQKDEARSIAEGLAATIEETPYVWKEEIARLGVSSGVCVFDAGKSVEHVFITSERDLMSRGTD